MWVSFWFGIGRGEEWLYDSTSNFRDWNFLDCMQVIFASLADIFVNRVTFQVLHDWPCNMALRKPLKIRLGEEAIFSE